MYLTIYTSHFPVEAPPCRWLTFRDQPSGKFGSSYIGPPPGCVILALEVEAEGSTVPKCFLYVYKDFQ